MGSGPAQSMLVYCPTSGVQGSAGDRSYRDWLWRFWLSVKHDNWLTTFLPADSVLAKTMHTMLAFPSLALLAKPCQMCLSDPLFGDQKKHSLIPANADTAVLTILPRTASLG